MIPPDWAPPCGMQCTQKFSAFTQIPWRVFCKKGCNADGDTWEECVEACNEICYKDPVLKDQQWSAYIDRSPGVASHSQDCFRACVAGCGYKFDIPPEIVNQVQPNRLSMFPPVQESKPSNCKYVATSPPPESSLATENMPGTSA